MVSLKALAMVPAHPAAEPVVLSDNSSSALTTSGRPGLLQRLKACEKKLIIKLTVLGLILVVVT